MKKINLVLAAMLAIAPLAGCTDAEAKLKDSSNVVMKVGSKTITKGDMYALMKSSAGAPTAINEATRIISAQEIEVTDDMKNTAQSTLDSYKALYGDSFASYLETSGMTEDEYVNDYLLPSLQAEQLVDKYITEDMEALVAKYSPVKATVIKFSTKEDAEKALSELKDGSKTPEEAAEENSSDTTPVSRVYTLESSDIDSTVRTNLINSKMDDGWYISLGFDSQYYVVRNDADNVADFESDFRGALQTIDAVGSAATTHFFKKYGFHIYDKTIYDAVAADYPEQLVQE